VATQTNAGDQHYDNPFREVDQDFYIEIPIRDRSEIDTITGPFDSQGRVAKK